MNSSDVTLLKDKIDQLTKLYENNINDFDTQSQKWKDFDEKSNQILAERKNDKVTINVGGTNFTTTIGTLLAPKNSLFHQLIHRGEIDGLFFDRPPILFEYLLDYMRTQRLNVKRLKKELLYEDFLEEAKYFGISDFSSVKPSKCPVKFVSMEVSGYYPTQSSKEVADLQKQDLSTHVLTNSPGWIQIEFDKPVEFEQMEVGGITNNSEWETSTDGWGAGCEVLTSLYGNEWTKVGNLPLGWGNSIATFKVDKSIAKFVKLSHNSWIGIGYLNVIPM